MAATGTSALSNEVKPLYQADYLIAAQTMTGLDQFTDLRTVMGGERGSSVNFPILENLQPQSTALSELGDVNPVQMSASEVVITLYEWGNAVQVTRFVKATAYPDVYKQAAQAVGYNQAESIDWILRPYYGQGTRVVYPSGVSARTSLTQAYKLTSNSLLRLTTLARGTRTPTFEDGSYVSIIHPNTQYDLLTDTVVQGMMQYQRADMLFNGELGTWQGIRFVQLAGWKVFWGQGAAPSGNAATTLNGAIAIGASSIVVASASNINIGDQLVIQDAAETGNTWSDTNEAVWVTSVSGTTIGITAQDPGPNNAGGTRFAHASGTTVLTAWNANGSANAYMVPIVGPQSITKAASSETGAFGVATVTGPFDVLGRFLNHGWYQISGWQRTTDRWLTRLEVGGSL